MMVVMHRHNRRWLCPSRYVRHQNGSLESVSSGQGRRRGRRGGGTITSFSDLIVFLLFEIVVCLTRGHGGENGDTTIARICEILLHDDCDSDSNTGRGKCCWVDAECYFMGWGGWQWQQLWWSALWPFSNVFGEIGGELLSLEFSKSGSYEKDLLILVHLEWRIWMSNKAIWFEDREKWEPVKIYIYSTWEDTFERWRW